MHTTVRHPGLQEHEHEQFAVSSSSGPVACACAASGWSLRQSDPRNLNQERSCAGARTGCIYISLKDVPNLISVLCCREQDGNAGKEQHTHGKQCRHARESDAAFLGRACQCLHGAGASAERRLG